MATRAAQESAERVTITRTGRPQRSVAGIGGDIAFPPTVALVRLGGVDGFDQDKHAGEGDEGGEVLGGLLAA
jgi:hypothetical protein